MENIKFVFSSLIFGILFSSPGLLFGHVLGRHGIVRPRHGWVIAQTLICTFGMRILFPEIPLIIVLISVSVFSPIFYKNELWFTMLRGRWWWLKVSENETKS